MRWGFLRCRRSGSDGLCVRPFWHLGRHRTADGVSYDSTLNALRRKHGGA